MEKACTHAFSICAFFGGDFVIGKTWNYLKFDFVIVFGMLFGI